MVLNKIIIKLKYIVGRWFNRSLKWRNFDEEYFRCNKSILFMGWVKN